MNLNPKILLDDLVKKLSEFDRKGAAELCDELILFLYRCPDPFPATIAEKILQSLRAKKMFAAMQRVADTLIHTNRHSFRIRRQYAQSLIDTGNYSAALCILSHLEDEIKNVTPDKVSLKEFREVRGLTGRVYKQLYINANSPENPVSIEFIKKACAAYNDIYCIDQECLWHGINVLAIIQRARQDGIMLDGYPDSKVLAEKILGEVEKKYEDSDQQADGWDFAIAAEACIALNRPESAIEWLNGYFSDPRVDAFEIASTLRQMEEVWKLDMNSEMGKLILPLMRAQLLRREGGNVLIDPTELRQQKDSEESTTGKYKELLKESGDSELVKASNKGLEKVFGADSYNSYKWMMTGIERGRAVARIGRESTTGLGTGFLLYGKALHEKLGDELVLITNEHVINKDGSGNSLAPSDVVIIFEALSREEELSVSEIIWSSPRTELDATILRFDADNTARLKELTAGVKIYPLAPMLPLLSGPAVTTHRVYIIGHPAGGALQFSFQDNLLLDHQDPKIHYRTPTVGGSSGSPVFNAKWDLIGLHHAGRSDMPKLNGKPGIYEANEGIWIQAVRKKLKEAL